METSDYTMKSWLSTMLTAVLVSIPAFTIGSWIHVTYGFKYNLVFASGVTIVGLVWAYRYGK